MLGLTGCGRGGGVGGAGLGCLSGAAQDVDDEEGVGGGGAENRSGARTERVGGGAGGRDSDR